MSNYALLILDDIVHSFSILGAGHECKFSLSLSGQLDVTKGLSINDKVIGYITTPKEQFCYLFTITDINHSGDCTLIKEFETSVGPNLEDAPETVKEKILGYEQTDSILMLTEEEYYSVINLVLSFVTKNINLPPQSIVFKTKLETDYDLNRILFGAPGTGKSYDLDNDRKLLLGDSGLYERVTLYPDYTYSHFVGTYKPITDDKGTRKGEIRYEFVPGPFMRVYVNALKSGRTENPQPHLLLIEEINRAKVAAVFGEVFQLLDRDDDGVSEYEIHASQDIRNYLAKELDSVPSAFETIRIPNNMFIWATMNSADQGVFPIDTAFKRRWNFEYLGINHNDSLLKGRVILGNGVHAVEVDWNQLRKAINHVLTSVYQVNEDKLLGPFFLSKKVLEINEDDGKIIDRDKFIDVFKSKIIMYLYEDAAKQNKHKLFKHCNIAGYSTTKYSSICDAFDEIGIEIFGDGFKDLYDQQGV